MYNKEVGMLVAPLPYNQLNTLRESRTSNDAFLLCNYCYNALSNEMAASKPILVAVSANNKRN